MKRLHRFPQKAYRYVLGVAVALHLQRSAEERRRSELTIRLGSHAVLIITILGFGATVFTWPEYSRIACVITVALGICVRLNRDFLRAARIMGRWQDRHVAA